MTDSEKIQILLKEYETLRAEMIQRFNHRFGFLTIIGGLGTFLLFKASELSIIQTLALVITVIFVILVWLWIGALIAACSRQVAELEKQINELAGEELLRWETIQIKRRPLHKVHRKK